MELKTQLDEEDVSSDEYILQVYVIKSVLSVWALIVLNIFDKVILLIRKISLLII
jgi:hypothetical protein